MRRVLFDRQPFSFVAGTVEAGENDRAALQPGDDRKELGHGRNAANESRGDNRVRRGGAAPNRRLLLEQAVAPLRRVERTLGGEHSGPVLRQDFEKAMYDLPVLRQVFRNEVPDALETGSFGRYAVEKSREASG